MELTDGSRVAVVGGGPAGSFVSFFLLETASRTDLKLQVDIYESKDFSKTGPPGCNHCGGIISESLVQMLATEGINLPDAVVQRGIDSYVLHSDVGTVRIDTPLFEKRIAAVYRGSGPKGSHLVGWQSLDGYLLELACSAGATLIQRRVESITSQDGRPVIQAKEAEPRTYDLVIGAVGVNSPSLKIFEGLGFNYEQPKTTKTFISEFHYGDELIRQYLGSSMHVFLLPLPRLEFAALIPKGEYATLCLLGHDIDRELVERFLAHPAVRSCFPPEWETPTGVCQCLPKINFGGAKHFFGDRAVMIGDCGVTRLFKDGIGAAYRTAKACATTIVFDGVSAEAFGRFYSKACRDLARDNAIGKVVFSVVTLFRLLKVLRRGMVIMIDREQNSRSGDRPMSTVLWDTFTGSAPYKDILLRALHPGFLLRLTGDTFKALLNRGQRLRY